MRIVVVGCGEAFGSGGRANTCFWVEAGGLCFLVDCGATSLPRMRALGLDPFRLDGAVISHLHGDHFGGLAALDRYFHVHGKERPFTLMGPHGLEPAFAASLEAAFPGACAKPRRYRLDLRGYGELGPLRVSAYPVLHDPETYPHALRMQVGDEVLAFSGDTAWTDTLLAVAEGADLFLCECQSFGPPQGQHIGLPTLREMRDRLRCRRIALTHMGELLEHLPLPDFETLDDGMEIVL